MYHGHTLTARKTKWFPKTSFLCRLCVFVFFSPSLRAGSADSSYAPRFTHNLLFKPSPSRDKDGKVIEGLTTEDFT